MQYDFTKLELPPIDLLLILNMLFKKTISLYLNENFWCKHAAIKRNMLFYMMPNLA
jgi:hypothetical protein